MKLEDKVLSLSLSKELWDRGVRIDSYWEWRWNEYWPKDKKARLYHWQGESIVLDKGSRGVSAPLLIELLEVMPSVLEAEVSGMGGQYGDFYLTLWKEGTLYFCGYEVGGYDELHPEEDTNSANAVAKCLIWLLDEGYVTTKEINNGKDSNDS